jgi:hypothetical protein
MNDSNEMLTQESIDAMVNNNVSKKAPAHRVAAPAAASRTQTMQSPAVMDNPVIKVATQAYRPAKPAEQSGDHEECIAAGEIQAMGAQISELLYRLSRLEAAVAKNDGKSATSNDMSSALGKATIAQVKNIASQVEIISEGLRGTAGYNLNKTFKCGSCNTVGIVAIKVKCNQCGQENWWGWWPKKK